MGDVLDISAGASASSKKDDEQWLKRHAMQLAAQLPDNHEHALKVIFYLWELETEFLSAPAKSADPFSTLSIFCNKRTPKPDTFPK